MDLKALSDGGSSDRTRDELRETERQSLNHNWRDKETEALQRAECIDRRPRGDSA
ncbi:MULTISPECIES: hypothetical protein [Paraburkholderia]|uniref:hypothetical protein n=1 Tax=Paraburkholderia TaxID=1822464 RepID=UPI001655BD07|nr:hypothetical protein [Paraburkholderia podalyriae]